MGSLCNVNTADALFIVMCAPMFFAMCFSFFMAAKCSLGKEKK